MSAATETPAEVIRSLRTELAASKRTNELLRQQYDDLKRHSVNQRDAIQKHIREAKEYRRRCEYGRDELLEIRSGDGVLGDLESPSIDDVPEQLNKADRGLILRTVEILEGE